MVFDKNNMEIKDKEQLIILAIESSCDETACAVVKNGREVLSNVVASQIEIHRRFGGVVPEIASRNHTLSIESVVADAIKQAGVTKDDIDAIGVTYGAGLLGALLVGVNFAKGLSYSWKKPLYAISHIKGHLATNYINSTLEPPYLCLLASGGHTAILKVDDYESTELICQSRDDAAGEAFDKIGRVLGLQYPGGPEIEKLAKQGNATFDLPKPRFLKNEDLYYSYSGLKTSVINLMHKMNQRGEEINKADVACSFQNACLGQLVDVLKVVIQKTQIKKIAIAGGVSCNLELRARIDELKKSGCEVHYPEIKYCTDNASMIASACYFYIKNGGRASEYDLDAKATVSLTSKEPS